VYPGRRAKDWESHSPLVVLVHYMKVKISAFPHVSIFTQLRLTQAETKDSTGEARWLSTIVHHRSLVKEESSNRVSGGSFLRCRSCVAYIFTFMLKGKRKFLEVSTEDA
jgi:hypothetical protein